MLKGTNPILKEYFSILSKNIPDFLYEYIDTKEMQRLAFISQNCGTDYTNIFNNKVYYSILDHSVGVALIVWNFTKDKKQTLAGLFHDIATPTFKHCIDFMNGDYKTQESTEELTTEIIKNSSEIMHLLERDNIKLEEVQDYHIYPIADNDLPKLSADRLEYNFSGGLFFDNKKILNLEIIKELYSDIVILTNEEGIKELGFAHKEIAEKFVHNLKNVWPMWISNKDKLTMQFIADTVRKMANQGYITKEDLYTLKESEIIDKIENCKDKTISETFKKFENANCIYESEEKVFEKYSVSLEGKRRYIVPLVKTGETETKRVVDISEIAKNDVATYLNSKTKRYAYFDFNF